MEALKDAAKGAGGGIRGRRTRDTLVVAEVALSVILLSAASLAIRGFADLLKVNLGFQPRRTLMMGVLLPATRYVSVEQRNLRSEMVGCRLEGRSPHTLWRDNPRPKAKIDRESD